MDDGGAWSFMPGDTIELEVQVLTRSRVKSVLAIFAMRGVTSGSGGPRLVLGGEYESVVGSFERTSEGRLTRAVLSLNEEHSTVPPAAGDYVLIALEVITFNDNRLPSDALPDLTIRIEQEPSDEQTARFTRLRFAGER